MYTDDTNQYEGHGQEQLQEHLNNNENEQQPQQEQATHEQSSNQEPEQQESEQQRNWRTIRDEKKQLERERDEYYRKLNEMYQQQQQMQQQNQQPQQEEKDPLENLSPDDFVEAKHVKDYIKKVNDKLEQYQQQVKTTDSETRLRNENPDFYSVVNQDNLEKLNKKYPEIAQTLSQTNDLYTAGKSAYRL